MLKFKDKLKAFRQKLKKTQKEMAIDLSINEISYQRYESGKSVPGAKVIEGLIRLGVDANWLLEPEGPEAKKVVVSLKRIEDSTAAVHLGEARAGIKLDKSTWGEFQELAFERGLGGADLEKLIKGLYSKQGGGVQVAESPDNDRLARLCRQVEAIYRCGDFDQQARLIGTLERLMDEIEQNEGEK